MRERTDQRIKAKCCLRANEDAYPIFSARVFPNNSSILDSQSHFYDYYDSSAMEIDIITEKQISAHPIHIVRIVRGNNDCETHTRAQYKQSFV